MRNLFLALVLANLMVAAWYQWFSSPAGDARVRAGDLPGIQLLSELDPQVARSMREQSESAAVRDAVGTAQVTSPPDSQADDAAADDADTDDDEAADGQPVAVAASVPEPRCVSVGPFRELAQAATAASSLRAAGHTPSQRVAEGEVWVGYWVYLDAIATVAEANDILARVREGGVTDSYVIPGTETGSLVSVGVFSEVNRAGRRRDELRALGFDPVVADRTQRATVYWVDVTLTPDETFDLDALQAPGRIVRLEQRVCPTAED